MTKQRIIQNDEKVHIPDDVEVKVYPLRVPGMRVNFRPEEEVAELLEHGYLELVYLSSGSSVACTIRKGKEQEQEGRHYSVKRAFVGQSQGQGLVNHAGPGAQYTLEELMKTVDLHAFQWYPNV